MKNPLTVTTPRPAGNLANHFQPISTPTLGQRAAAALKDAKVKAQSEGKTLSWSEVAAIIDRCTPATPAKADSSHSKAISSAFGDRKAIPPTPEQVEAYSASIGYPMNGQAWCDCYEQKGWLVGRTKMKDWQSACRNWKTNDYAKGGIALNSTVNGKAKDYSKI